MRALRWIFLLCLLGNAVLAVRVVWGMSTDRGWLVYVRSVLFHETTGEREAFEIPPQALLERGFRTDPEPLIRQWREQIAEQVAYTQGLGPAATDAETLALIRSLVPRFSKNGGGGCGLARDLMHQMQRLPEGDGEGCCSDHAEAFLALMASYGVFARQVHHAHHTFNEVWLPESRSWIFVDTHYAVLAQNPDGAGHLSLMQLRDRYLAGEPVVYEFIGTSDHRFAHMAPSDSPLYDDAQDFRDVRITWGNNVFEEDRFDERLGILPKAVRQAVGLSVGPLPPILVLSDEHSTSYASELARRRRTWAAGLGLLLSGTLAYPLARWLRLGARD